MFEQLGTMHALLPTGLGLLALLVAAVIIDLIVKHILIRAVRALAKRSSTGWDDALVAHNVFGRLVQVVPPLIVFLGQPFVPHIPEAAVQLIRNVAMRYMVLMLSLIQI